MQDLIIKFMSLGSLVIGIFVVSFVLMIYFKSHGPVVLFLKKYGLLLIFIFSFVATVGSLVMSLIWELPPCDLCWYQRIFMYPIAVISAFALYKKDYKSGSIYSLILAIFGFVIAFYHYSLQMSSALKNTLEICSFTGNVDCSIPEFVQFGFVTTPFISITVFVLIIISAIYSFKRDFNK